MVKKVPTQLAIAICGAILITHPGTFVPDIHRFVNGIECFTKRTLVILFEDSSIDEAKQMTSVVQLAMAAYLAQRAPSWRPAMSMATSFIQLAIEGWRTASAYDVESAAKLTPFELENLKPGKAKPMHVVSALLDQIQSFQGDMRLVRLLAHEEKLDARRMPPQPNRPSLMSLYHSNDQHCTPNIAYTVDDSEIERLCLPPSTADSDDSDTDMEEDVTDSPNDHEEDEENNANEDAGDAKADGKDSKTDPKKKNEKKKNKKRRKPLDKSMKTNKTFRHLFDTLFGQLTGLNPRRLGNKERLAKALNNPNVPILRAAQKRYWDSLIGYFRF